MERVKRCLIPILFVACILLVNSCEQKTDREDDLIHINRSMKVAEKYFSNPPLRYKSRPLWFWNGELSRSRTREIITGSKEKGYYGLGILPSYGMTPEYMSPEFLDHYRYALDVADSLGMKMCLYDEFYFPSGMAGGNLVKEYPEALSKRLDKEEFIFDGPGVFRQSLNLGLFMGAVAMELNSKERLDISDNYADGAINTELPEGEWRVMIFHLNPDGSTGRNHVDYLDPQAVGRFIELTYEKFYNAFPEHFGTTIDFAFYDEPCLRWVEEGRSWTGLYNSKFQEQYGFSPVEYYPAMWYDIGKETISARNMLYGFRADLFSSGFPGTINNWCREHNIELTGHVDQEEILNPVSICGDLIKAFKYQDIPCVDQIAHFGRASKIYKLISSAAYNYDKTLVATETYGAVSNMPVENLYKEAMDQFAKGINLMEPHAVWYSEKADIPPDLSPGNSTYGPSLAQYNEYIGRLQLMLQGGQHLADIAILYPIASLQADYTFQPGDPGLGGKTSWEADYMDIGEMLSLDLKTDFTFIHPEILDDKCQLQEAKISLENGSENSQYSTLFIPGSRTIKWSNLKKIKDFYDNGGSVIATSVLPESSVEIGHDKDVQNTIREMFGEQAFNTTNLTSARASSIWNTGGFLPAYVLDGDRESSWRPSSGSPDGESLEILFGRALEISRVEIKPGKSMAYSFRPGWVSVDEDQSFSFKMFVKVGDEWIETRSAEDNGNSMAVSIETQQISGIRVIIESGKTDKVSVSEILFFDHRGNEIEINPEKYSVKENDRGGKAFFIPAPNAEIVRTALNDASRIWDVRIHYMEKLSDGNLSYIHKKMDGKDIYFFANSSGNEIEVPVILRGEKQLSIWDPHTGLTEKYPSEIISENGKELTSMLISLGPVKSVFFVTR